MFWCNKYLEFTFCFDVNVFDFDGLFRILEEAKQPEIIGVKSNRTT